MLDEARYFDVLPLHPQPRYMESFTSWMTRLGTTNRFTSKQGLRSLCAARDALVYWKLTDFPRSTYGSLPTTSCCSLDSIYATTFLYLGEKFSRIRSPSSLGMFLIGSVAGHLRFCPRCISEEGYYRLPWRFMQLTGCPDHGCQLVDQCPHCGERLAVMDGISAIGICQKCGGDIATCKTSPLSARQIETQRRLLADLEFLLRPIGSGEGPLCGVEHVGLRLSYLRHLRGQTEIQIASMLGTSSRIVLAIEGRIAGRKLAAFRHYSQYCALLGVGLEDLFRLELPSFEYSTTASKRTAEWSSERIGLTAMLHETEIVKKLRAAFDALKTGQELVTQRKVAHAAGLELRGLPEYPKIKALLQELKEYRREQNRGRAQQRVEEWIARIVSAADQLEHGGHRVNWRAISRIIGRDVHPLALHYPRIRLLLKDVEERQKTVARQKRGESLVKLILRTEKGLLAEGKRPTRDAILARMGLCCRSAVGFPGVAQAIREIAIRNRQRRAKAREACEAAMKRRVIEAAGVLRERGEPTTRSAIAALVGVAAWKLDYFPRVRRVVRQMAARIRSKSPARRIRYGTQRDRTKKYKKDVLRAIDKLHRGNSPITAVAIARAAGTTTATLKKYPSVMAIVARARRESSRERRARWPERDSCLAATVPDVIRRLQASGRTITGAAICKECKVHRSVLPRLPRFQKTVKAALQELDLLGRQALKEQISRQVDEIMKRAKNLGLWVSRAYLLASTRTPHSLPGTARDRMEIVKRAMRNQRIDGVDKQQSGEQLVNDAVQKAIGMLRSTGQAVTEEALHNIVAGQMLDVMEYYRLFATRLRRRIHEEVIASVTLSAIEDLQSSGVPLTRAALAASLGVSVTGLSGLNCPRVRVVWVRLSADRQSRLSQSREARRRDLIARAEAAMNESRAAGKPISMVSVAKLVGVKTDVLRNKRLGISERIRQIHKAEWRLRATGTSSLMLSTAPPTSD